LVQNGIGVIYRTSFTWQLRESPSAGSKSRVRFGVGCENVGQ